MAPRWDKRLRLPKSEGGATICEKHEFIEAHFRDPEMSWEVDQAVTQAKDDGKRMEARLQELGEEANNLEDALSETEADRDRLAAELQDVRDELATAHEEIILSRQSEGDTMADLLATREERDKLRAELAARPVAVEVPTWSTDAFCAHVGLEGAFSAGDIRVFFAGAKACHGWISKEVHPIPSDRVLKEGEVAVPKTQWTVAQMLANAWERFPLKCGERDALVAEWNALRSTANEKGERS